MYRLLCALRQARAGCPTAPPGGVARCLHGACSAVCVGRRKAQSTTAVKRFSLTSRVCSAATKSTPDSRRCCSACMSVCSVLYKNHAKAVHGRHPGAVLCLLRWGACVTAGTPLHSWLRIQQGWHGVDIPAYYWICDLCLSGRL